MACFFGLNRAAFGTDVARAVVTVIRVISLIGACLADAGVDSAPLERRGNLPQITGDACTISLHLGIDVRKRQLVDPFGILLHPYRILPNRHRIRFLNEQILEQFIDGLKVIERCQGRVLRGLLLRIQFDRGQVKQTA